MAKPVVSFEIGQIIGDSLQRGFFTQFVKDSERQAKEEAKLLWQRIRLNVSRRYPPASKPGENPAYRSGRGFNSIIVVRIYRGPNNPSDYEVAVALPFTHMADLNEGTERIAPRPWMDIAMREIAAQLR